MVELKVQMTLREYRRLVFSLTYKRPIAIFLAIVGIVNVAAFILYLTGYESSFLSKPVFNLVFGVLLILITPLSIFLNTKKTFDTNKYLQEECNWTITEDKIKIKGKSFQGEYDWTNIHKISKLNNFIIIYKDIFIANFIPNSSFQKTGDYELFWEYVKKHNLTIK